MRAWAAWMLALALAGCSDGSETAAHEPSDVVLPEATLETGSVVGVVVDEAIVPVPGASVSTDGQDITAESDGAFVLNGLEPGNYIVAASAAGHLPAQAQVLVRAGEISDVRIVLPTDSRVTPYHSSQSFDGFMQAHVGVATAALVALAPESAPCTCTFDIRPEPGAWTFVVEAFGDPSIMANPTGLWGDVYWEWLALDNPDTEADETSGASDHGSYPVLAHVPRAAFEPTVADFQVRLTGGNWIHAEEDFQLVVTTFYHEPAPTGWSFVQ